MVNTVALAEYQLQSPALHSVVFGCQCLNYNYSVWPVFFVVTCAITLFRGICGICGNKSAV